MTESATCPICGHEISVERCGDLEMLRCTQCSWRLGSTVYQQPLFIRPEEFHVRLKWEGDQVSLKEVMAAKKTIPVFRDMAVPKILELLRQSPTYNLGTFNRHIALQLQENAKEHGLSIILEPVN
jgi:hypothetical protein